MFLVKTTEGDSRSIWLLGNVGLEPEPVTFESGLRCLHQKSLSLRQRATETPEPFSDEDVAAMSVVPPFGGTKILCVGRNYKPHAEELGNPIPIEPLWFSKPPSSLVPSGGTVVIPEEVGRIDYEGELALVVGRRCRRLREAEALSCLAGVTAALDVTARELQKKDGQWTRAKGFDTFCPLGPVLLPFTEAWLDARLTTTVNDRLVQDDRTSSLIFSVPQLLAHLTACMTLEPGDVILTGTPAGVGPIHPGDRVSVKIEGPQTLTLSVSVESAPRT
ncbi:MAG TPA: fumarylacetoacetate hydrolase family protein [Candidatus Ozemobacteraceae bacterium]|nr:fumarylacetoacetate hydrolase family protein [Candidatus Ozemobacteraceae bacterium]